MKYDITARQGKTLYLEGEAFPTNISASQLRTKTLRGTLLDTDIAFDCSWTGDDATKATFAISISDVITGTLDYGRTYEYNLDAYDSTNTYEIANGTISVRKGQKRA